MAKLQYKREDLKVGMEFQVPQGKSLRKRRIVGFGTSTVKFERWTGDGHRSADHATYDDFLTWVNNVRPVYRKRATSPV